MIILEQLYFFYKKKKVLDIGYFKIQDGEKIAVMGLNGAGKTTLAELILGLKRKYRGRITKTRNYVYNAVFQDQSFVSEVSLKQVFKMYCDLYKVNLDYKPYFEAFDLLGIENQTFKKISGGQKQKFKFLIALLNQPDFLLLDEISTGLDYLWRHKIIDLVKNELNKQPTNNLLLISHDPEEIGALCNRVIMLTNGKISADISLTGSEEEKKQQVESLVNQHA